MDGSHEYDYINLKKEFITKENILHLFSKYKVPTTFDLLSIDIDGNVIHIWIELMSRYKPRVVVIEYAPAFGYDYDKVPEYKKNYVWDRRNQIFGIGYSGSSIEVLRKVGNMLGYDLVYANVVNLFFIQKTIIKKNKYNFKNKNDSKKLYNAVNKKYLAKIKNLKININNMLDRKHIPFDDFINN